MSINATPQHLHADALRGHICGLIEQLLREAQLASIDAAMARNDRTYQEARLREHAACAVFYLESGDQKTSKWLAKLADNDLQRLS